MPKKLSYSRIYSACILVTLGASAAAQDVPKAADADGTKKLDSVVITGSSNKLDKSTPTASRLG